MVDASSSLQMQSQQESLSRPHGRRSRSRSRSRRRKNVVKVEEFSAIDTPHPYGVLPGGNRFFRSHDDDDDTTTTNNNNTEQDLFGDTLWQQILSFCTGSCLGQIVQSSRYLYVAGHQPELWRDLVLRYCNNSNSNNNQVLDKVGTCWKDTYVLMTTTKTSFVPHCPISMSGIYSDELYRIHLCRSFAIPSAWLLEEDEQQQDTTSVPRVLAKNMTSTIFLEQYEQQNIPVIVQGAATSTRAVQYWNDFNYLAQHQPKETTTTTTEDKKKNSVSFRTTSGAAPLPVNFTLDAYHQYCQFSYLEESPLYLFDRTALAPPQAPPQQQQPPDGIISQSETAMMMTNKDEKEEEKKENQEEEELITPTTTTATKKNPNPWSDDFFSTFYETCPYWNPHLSKDLHGHDLFQYLGNNNGSNKNKDESNNNNNNSMVEDDGSRPDHTWLIAGPQRSGSVFHIDPNATHAWNACIVGRKRWIFYPPGVTPPGVHPSADGDEVALPLSVGEWLTQYWTEHNQQLRNSDVTKRPLECTVQPGDVIFVPHGWWHMVINLDDTLNIAMTHNYVSGSNLGNVLQFLQYRQNQISGCRDRIESIKPEQLYDSFVSALTIHHPQTLKQAQSQHGWTCAAWHDDDDNNNDDPKLVQKQGEEEEKEMDGSKSSNNNNNHENNNNQRKRPNETNDLEDGNTTASRSVMAKTEKVAAFSFSFL